jgi:hypothetical protein
LIKKARDPSDKRAEGRALRQVVEPLSSKSKKNLSTTIKKKKRKEMR